MKKLGVSEASRKIEDSKLHASGSSRRRKVSLS